jgi:hypothetical protein
MTTWTVVLERAATGWSALWRGSIPEQADELTDDVARLRTVAELGCDHQITGSGRGILAG